MPKTAMRKSALSSHRPWLLVSLAAGLSYAIIEGGPLGEVWQMAIKGAAVGALAIYAWQRHPSRDAKWVAAFLALSAAGDVTVNIDLIWGGALFAAANSVAVAFYLTHRRHAMRGSQIGAAIALFLIGPLFAWLATRDPGFVAYGAFIGALAGSAWMSRFPRYRVGIGAILFLMSDMLIFADAGFAQDNPVSALLIWPLYFIGQFMIATGIVQTLRKELPEAD